MRDDDGRKLDHKTLEQLRIRAVRQIEQGAHPEDIAQALGMTRAAVYSWLAKYRQGGLEALELVQGLVEAPLYGGLVARELGESIGAVGVPGEGPAERSVLSVLLDPHLLGPL